MSRGRSLVQEQADVERWNLEHEVGTPVRAWPGVRAPDVAPLETVTSSRAWLLGGHTAVVMVQDRSGAIALTHVEPRPAVHRGPADAVVELPW